MALNNTTPDVTEWHYKVDEKSGESVLTEYTVIFDEKTETLGLTPCDQRHDKFVFCECCTLHIVTHQRIKQIGTFAMSLIKALPYNLTDSEKINIVLFPQEFTHEYLIWRAIDQPYYTERLGISRFNRYLISLYKGNLIVKLKDENIQLLIIRQNENYIYNKMGDDKK